MRTAWRLDQVCAESIETDDRQRKCGLDGPVPVEGAVEAPSAVLPLAPGPLQATAGRLPGREFEPRVYADGTRPGIGLRRL